MSTTLDSILNWIIPPGIIIFFLAFMYKQLKEPLDGFFGWVKGLFVRGNGGEGMNPYGPSGFDPWLNEPGAYVPNQ